MSTSKPHAAKANEMAGRIWPALESIEYAFALLDDISEELFVIQAHLEEIGRLTPRRNKASAEFSLAEDCDFSQADEPNEDIPQAKKPGRKKPSPLRSGRS